ncbi:MAG: hypothetical protein B7Y45_03705 [Sphingomonas sp. 28-66-16]|nr:MAG: hypothetical protein B7Y45_03705 [Sphingomonas sp. 28-66-16]
MHGRIMPNAEGLSPAIDAAAEAAINAIPPLWPLAATVAVNPFLGQATEPLDRAAARLARTAGAAITMPRGWFADRIDEGRITDADLAAALAASDWAGKPATTDALKAATARPLASPVAVPTIADLAAAASGIDWPGIIADRIGHWAAGYFDAGQALWRANSARGAYVAWRETATHDLTPEILGLPGFAAFVAAAPETARGAIGRSTDALGLAEAALEGAFTRLLTTLGGWAQLARYNCWQAELGGTTDDTALDLLAIRLLWEEALFERYRPDIAAVWPAACAAHAEAIMPGDDQRIGAILQEAAERAGQRTLALTLAAPATAQPAAPAFQAAFCIDVRSEVFRRALESVDPGVQTLGFAGFFGLATAHRRFASDVVERRLPVLLNPGVASVAGSAATLPADQAARFRARATRAWGRFKLAAVSSFAFVEAAGPLYGGKLVRDALAATRPDVPGGPPPQLDPPLALDDQLDAAEKILRAMSLTERFAPLVLIAGHGARVTNNPHASALQCGACGGYSGEVNARLLAGLLNAPAVRDGLRHRGIDVPATTLFVGALHDTTSDDVTLYDGDFPAPSHRDALSRLRDMLARAGALARTERALRLPRATSGGAIEGRTRDWAETRPEWGLAGCQAFIAAPRARTLGKPLAGRAFLHDYDWRADQDFGVLELILTAPVVVASWISLQYYGSAVAPALFGGGNKLLHNVTGGIGVVEGNGGTLRGGLPWQSVHDGAALAHEPLRLTVCVEAPCAAIGDILRRHDHVRALFDNRWLHLLVLDDAGQVAWRYAGNGEWEAAAGSLAAPVPAI